MDESGTRVHILPPDFSKWVDDMDAAANEVDLGREEAAWNKPSIYLVTGFYTGCDKPINAFTPQDDKYVNNLVLSYCTNRGTSNLSRLASHPLELYRMSLLPEGYTIVPFNSIMYRMIENAVELRESGVRFRANYNCRSLMDINFDPNTGTLELPVFAIHDGTEHIILNMIAYEQIHVGAGNAITSYVMFMDALIDTEDDVKLLLKKNIITNSLGSYKDVANLIHRLPQGAAHHPNDRLNLIRSQLSEYYEEHIKWTRRWYQYLHNPGKVLSVVAFSLLLALVQTVCSVLSLLRQK